MNRISRVSVVLIGLVAASAATAAPAPRIVCDGEPRLEGADRVLLSTDEVGTVQVVGAALPTKDDDDPPSMDPESFCQAHAGIDQFILPAPRLIDALPEPERETDRRDGLEPVSAAPAGPRRADDGDKDLDPEDDDDDAESAMRPNTTLRGPADGHDFKALPHEMSSQASCDVSATQAPRGFMWILLPLLFGLRCRRGTAR